MCRLSIDLFLWSGVVELFIEVWVFLCFCRYSVFFLILVRVGREGFMLIFLIWFLEVLMDFKELNMGKSFFSFSVKKRFFRVGDWYY